MTRDDEYGPAFHEWMEAEALRSATAIAPIVFDLIRPKSVVDIGCGTGAWLLAFQRMGVADLCGVDSHEMRRDHLLIPPAHYLAADLERPGSVQVGGKYDLAICLEVAEHLPAQSGEALIELLASLAPVVLFSAAVPGQGGRHHVNEQWLSYWCERFAKYGLVPVDSVRLKVWTNKDVAYYYAQNTLLFVRRSHLENLPQLTTEMQNQSTTTPDMVHPELYQKWMQRSAKSEARARECEERAARLRSLEPGMVSLRAVVASLPSLVIHAVKRRLGGRVEP